VAIAETWLGYQWERSEKIEALERVLYVIEYADKPLTKSDIEKRLEANHDYGFNNLGIRSYPQLLELIGAIKQTDSKYQATSEAESYLSKFRQADLFEHSRAGFEKKELRGRCRAK